MTLGEEKSSLELNIELFDFLVDSEEHFLLAHDLNGLYAVHFATLIVLMGLGACMLRLLLIEQIGGALIVVITRTRSLLRALFNPIMIE